MSNIQEIVIVDDDSDDRYLIKLALQEANYSGKVTEMENGELALKYLRACSNTSGLFILLDLNMPILKGEEVIQRVRDDEQLKHLPIAVLTTAERDYSVLRLYRLGANAFVTKPSSPNGWTNTMASLLAFWNVTAKLP